jgi:hypothetical protein
LNANQDNSRSRKRSVGNSPDGSREESAVVIGKGWHRKVNKV